MLLVDQVVPTLLLSLCSWLQASLAEGGASLMGETPAAVVDYSNAYSITDGSADEIHRVWCVTLALAGFLHNQELYRCDAQ